MRHHHHTPYAICSTTHIMQHCTAHSCALQPPDVVKYDLLRRKKTSCAASGRGRRRQRVGGRGGGGEGKARECVPSHACQCLSACKHMLPLYLQCAHAPFQPPERIEEEGTGCRRGKRCNRPLPSLAPPCPTLDATTLCCTSTAITTRPPPHASQTQTLTCAAAAAACRPRWARLHRAA